MGISIYAKEIEIFLNLCETKSLKMTADNFGLSISATSRQITCLENNLGVSLFDRTRRPMALTASGRLLARELTPTFARASAIVKAVQSHNAIRPELRIGIVDSLTYSLAPKFFKRIQSNFSRISCLTGTSDSLLQRLCENVLDVVLVSSPAENILNLRRLFFMKEPSVVILPKSYAEKFGKELTWSKLALSGLPYIEPYTKSGSGLLTNNFLKTQGLNFYGKLMIDNMGLKLKLVSEEVGWYITRPVGILNHREILNSVSVVPVPPPGFSRKLYLISSEKISQELYIEIFNTLLDVMQKDVLPQVLELFPWLEQEGSLAEPQK